MENNWIKKYLDNNNEVIFNVIYDVITKNRLMFKFIYDENNKISSLVLENGLVYNNTENINDRLEFTRELDLLKLHIIPFIYKERIQLYDSKYGIHGSIEYQLSNKKYYWEPIGKIFIY